MVSPRIMEKLIPSKLGSQSQCFVPMFLSFDRNLRAMLKMYPIKGAIFNRKTGGIISFPDINSGEYFKENKLEKEINWIYSDNLRLERKSRSLHTRKTIHESITNEYRNLILVLNP